MEPDVLYEVRGAAAWLTLNRESRRNALAPDTIDLLDHLLDRAEADDAVRVICLTGAGDRVFCSGADLGAARQTGTHGDAPARYARLLHRMLRATRPLVARVNGHCLGGGVGLLLACDLAYAREGVRLGTPEVTVGLFPMMVAPLLLRSVPRKRAMELMLTGEPVTAREAEALGLVTRTVPDGELDAAVDRVLATVAANAPEAIRLGRQAIAGVEGEPLGEAIERLAGRLSEVLATGDAAEGLSAFIEKRPPRWKGR